MSSGPATDAVCWVFSVVGVYFKVVPVWLVDGSVRCFRPAVVVSVTRIVFLRRARVRCLVSAVWLVAMVGGSVFVLVLVSMFIVKEWVDAVCEFHSLLDAYKGNRVCGFGRCVVQWLGASGSGLVCLLWTGYSVEVCQGGVA